MKREKLFAVASTFLSLFCWFSISGAEFASADFVIVQEKNSPAVRSAAAHLQKHLQLIADGKPAPGKTPYKFILREKDLGNKGIWETDDRETVFTGKDKLLHYAVSDFLEKQLGIVWMTPAETVYRKRDRIALKNTSGKIVDRYAEHFIWPGPGGSATMRATRMEWTRNVKADRFINWNTAHAFTTWWYEFGKQYPLYFSLNKNGVRGPRNSKPHAMDAAAAAPSADKKVNHQVQLCCSNPDLPDFIIAQHLKSQNAASMVNIANNDDASAFCHCAECKKLDADRPGIPEWPHISDRYLFLANQVAEKAAKLSPPRKVHFLAYCETEEPPAKTRVAENIVVTFCPTDYRLERCLVQLDNWIKMGAREIRMRPNLPCYFFSVLPVGFEKHAWKLFSETLKRPEVVGCNIDNLAAANPWTFSFPMYVMARTIISPETPFEVWEEEYLSGFGKGADEVRKYFELWRNNWERRINPDYGNILKISRYFNVGRGLLMNAKKYYTKADFDRAEEFLKAALEKDLTADERRRVNDLLLVNAQSRLVFLAATASGEAKTKYARDLLEFRKQHPIIMGYKTQSASETEIRWGDYTGLKKTRVTAEYDLPIHNTPTFWYFKVDPERVGEKEQWQLTTPAQFGKWGEMAATHTYWQGSPAMPHMSKKMKAFLTRYDGIGWYAQVLAVPSDWKDRNVYLLFGAVDESCKVFVNGKLVHTRMYKNNRDETKPFAADITSAIDWNKPDQTRVHVMVIDEAGEGGIWQRVYLVSKKKK